MRKGIGVKIFSRKKESSIPRVTYAGIYFVNKDTGWSVGDLGTLIKTIDGGGG